MAHLDEPTEDALNRKRELVAKVMAKSITPEEETARDADEVAVFAAKQDYELNHAYKDKRKAEYPDTEAVSANSAHCTPVRTSFQIQ